MSATCPGVCVDIAGMPLDDPIVMHDYDRNWPAIFRLRARAIVAALGGDVVSVNHVGSTAVPGLVSKPIIDISVAHAKPGLPAEATDAMAKLGYECYGSAGVPGRTFFRLEPGADGSPAVHVHVFTAGHPALKRDVRFRNALRASPALRREYSQIKCALALRFRNNLEAYNAGKEEFIGRVAGMREAPARWTDLVVTDETINQAVRDGGTSTNGQGEPLRRTAHLRPVTIREITAMTAMLPVTTANQSRSAARQSRSAAGQSPSAARQSPSGAGQSPSAATKPTRLVTARLHRGDLDLAG